MAQEKKRREQVGLVSVSVRELQRLYGENWAIVTEAFRRYGVSVHTGFGLDKRLDSEERLDAYLAKVCLRIDRSTPCIVKATDPCVVPSSPPMSPRSTSGKRGLSPKSPIARESTSDEEIPGLSRAEHDRALSRVTALRRPRPAKANHNPSSTEGGSRSSNRSRSSTAPPSEPGLRTKSPNAKVGQSSSSAEAGSGSSNIERGRVRSSVLPPPKPRPSRADVISSSAEAGSGSLTGDGSLLSGDFTISLPLPETSASIIQELYTDRYVEGAGAPTVPTSSPLASGVSVPSTCSGTDQSVEGAGAPTVPTFPSVAAPGVSSSIASGTDPSVDGVEALKVPTSSCVAHSAVSESDFKKLGKELLVSSRKSDLIITLPNSDDDFREELGECVDSMDWVQIERTSSWLMRKYGKGKRTLLPNQTLYVQLYDEFVAHVERQFGVCLISLLRNTPGMPEDKDINVAFIQQCVVVAEVARHFSTIVDYEQLPRGMESPPRVQTKPVSDADRVASGTVLTPSRVDLRDGVSPPRDQVNTMPIMSRCRVVLRRIASPDSSPPVRENRPRSGKRKAIIRSDDDEPAPTPKRKTRPRSESSNRSVSESEQSESESESSESALSPIQVNKNLADAGLHLGRNVRRRLRQTNEFLLCLEASMSTLSQKHINNTCDNMARLMKWYSKDQDPYTFQLSDLADMEKLHALVKVLVDAGTKAETRSKYLQALENFLRCIKRSKYKDSHAHLIADLKLIKKEVKVIKSRQDMCKRQEKVRQMADMVHKKDDSEKSLKTFNRAIETKLRPAVKKVFQEHKASPQKAVSSSDLLKVNVFFLSQFVKYGHRPVVFTSMPYFCYRAKESTPITSTGGLGALGPFRFLVTSKHSDKDIAFVPIPMSEEWGWLHYYVKYLRPQPADEKSKQLLFLNSVGHEITNPCDNLKKVMRQFGKHVLSPTDLRHCIETAAFNNLDEKDREDVATALCHRLGTARQHYITKRATRGFGFIAGIFNPSKSKSYAPTTEGSAVEETVTLEQYRPVSPAENAGNNGSESGGPSTPPPVRPRSENDARNTLISECFNITAGPLPTRKEYIDILRRNADVFPECLETPYSLFRESCREVRNKLRAAKVVSEIGRKRFKDKEAELKKELDQRKWFNQKCLKLALRKYEREVESEGRVTKHPNVGASV